MKQRRPTRRRPARLAGLALDYDVNLTPVPVNIPDVSYIPGLDTPTAGVTTDDSGMSVVTVVGSQGLPWWVWALVSAAAWGLFQHGRK